MKVPTPINLYKGLNKEFRRIRWIDQQVLWPLTFVVLGFIIAFAIFFVGLDALINLLLRLFNIKN